MTVVLSVLIDRLGASIPYLPYLTWPVLFYWIFYRPLSIPLLGLVVLGLLEDLLAFRTLGLTPLCFLGFYWCVLSLRSHIISKAFSVFWIAFALLLIPLTFFQPFSKLVLTFLIFPPIFLGCASLSRRI